MSSQPRAHEVSTVALVHHSRVARAQLACVVRDLGYDVVAEAATVSDLAREAATLLIVDGRVAELAQAIAILRDANPDAAILILASLEEISLVRNAVAAGADGAIRRPPLRSRVAEALAALRPV